MNPVALPLLGETELQALYQRARSPASSPLQRLLEQRQAGDVASRYRGGGLDYDESRPYQSGDEPRFINWRLTARTGQPFIKQFREERRPSVFIVLDRRSTMRFGTRVRLKVTQAARVAALAAFAAQQQGWSVGGVLLENEPVWFNGSTDAQAVWAMVRQCASLCPPLETVSGPLLAELLPLVQARLTRGTHVYLLSDFAGCTTNTEAPLLHLLQQHPVFAVQVLDPAELALPLAGKMTLHGFGGAQGRAADLDDPSVQQQFRSQATALHGGLEQRLRGLGCHYTRLLTDVDAPETLVPLPHGMGT